MSALVAILSAVLLGYAGAPLWTVLAGGGVLCLCAMIDNPDVLRVCEQSNARTIVAGGFLTMASVSLVFSAISYASGWAVALVV